MADKKLIAELEVQTGRSRQNLQEVTDALAQQGTAGAQNSSAITHALENIENATARVIQKEQDGRVITERDGKIIIQQYEALETAVRRFEAANGEIPPALQAALTTARSQFDLASQKIQGATAAVRQQGEVLKEGGVAWTGIGDQVNKALGRFGGIQVGILAAGAALREGIQLGTQFAHAIGTNFQAAEDAAASLKAGFAGVTNALVTDGLFAAVQQGEAFFKNFDDSINGSGKAIQGYNVLVAAGIDRQKALAVSTQDLRAIFDAYTLAQQGGADGLKLFDETAAKTDPSNLAKALTDLKGKFQELATAQAAETAQQKAHKEAIDGTIKSIEAEIAKMEAEKEARRLGLEQLQADIQERQNYKKALEDNARSAELGANVIEGTLTPSMRSELEELQRLSEHYEQNKQAIERMAKALKDDATQHSDYIRPEYLKRLQEIADLIEQYGKVPGATQGAIESAVREAMAEADAAAKTKSHNEIVKDANGVWTNVKETTSKVRVEQDGLKTTITNVKDEVQANTVKWDENTRTMTNVDAAGKKLGAPDGTLSAVKTKTHDAAEEAKHFNDALNKLADDAEAKAEKLLKMAEAIDKVRVAAAVAAGSGAGAPAPASSPPPVEYIGSGTTAPNEYTPP